MVLALFTVLGYVARHIHVGLHVIEKLDEQGQGHGIPAYWWVIICFITVVVVAASAVACHIMRKRRKMIEKIIKNSNENHINYNTFNSMKKSMDPDNLCSAIEKGAMESLCARATLMSKSQSCPNLQEVARILTCSPRSN
eukprot:1392385-Amorphochlora_amoeboformis.AAC.1